MISAFPSPLDLQYRWATLLTPAIQKDPDLILARAKEMHASRETLSSAQVLTRLLEGGGNVPPPAIKKISLKGKDGQTGEMKLNSTKRFAIISLTNIDPKRSIELEKVIKTLLS